MEHPDELFSPGQAQPGVNRDLIHATTLALTGAGSGTQSHSDRGEWLKDSVMHEFSERLLEWRES